MSIESPNSVKRFSGLPFQHTAGNEFRIQRVSVAAQPLPLFNEAISWRNIGDKAV
jgi:hypothetical protein